jgi:hypothetical protein
MKTLLIVAVVLTAFFGALPWGAYRMGMANMDAPPVPPDTVTYPDYEARAVWEERKEALPMALRPITPWHFYQLIWCSRDDENVEDMLSCGTEYPGLRAAAYVAKRYLDEHLIRRGLVWRYLSRAALTIWISRNWSVQQVVGELIRLKQTPG